MRCGYYAPGFETLMLRSQTREEVEMKVQDRVCGMRFEKDQCAAEFEYENNV